MKAISLFSLIILACISTCYSQIDLPTLISNSEKAVCYIETFDENDKPLKIGTGFFIDENGTCVTNYHVLGESKKIRITTIDKKRFEIAEIIKSSKEYDIVVFKIATSEKINYLKINRKLPMKGESIVTIGNPMGLNWSASEGIISSIRNTEHINIMQITAPISQGNSGCPILNRDGDVIGIAAFQLTKGQNLNFAVHISTLDSIRSNDAMFVNTPYLVVLPTDFEIAKNHLDSLMEISEHQIKMKIPDEKILKYIDIFIQKFPISAFGYIKKGKYYANKFDFTKAFEMYSNAISIVPKDPDSYYQRAIFLISRSNVFMADKLNEKMQIAINDLKKYGSFSPENLLKSYRLLSSCYEERKEYLKAIEYQTKQIEESVENNNDSIANLYVSRGINYWNLNNFDKANFDFDKAIELSPNCYTYKWKVRSLIKNEKFSEASMLLSDDCLKDQEDYYTKSFILVEIDGDLEKAKLYIEKSIRMLEVYISFGVVEKKYEQYYRLSAYLHGVTNEPIETLKDLKKMLEINPSLKNDYNFLKWMVDTKYTTKDYLGTLMNINSLIETFPEKVDLFEIKGNCLYDLFDYVGSIKAFTKAIDLNPKDGRLYRLRAMSKYYNKDKSGACIDLSKAGELDDYKAYELIKEYCN